MKPIMLTALLLAAPLAAAQTAPATPAVAPAPATAPTLQLTAPVGTTVKMLLTSTSTTTFSDVQVSAAPGSKISQAKLDELRQNLSQSMKPRTMTMTGKAFYKVAAQDASSITLIYTLLMTVPDQAGQKATPISMKFTQVFGNDGQIKDIKIDSDNPQIKAMFAGLPPEKLREMAQQNGSSLNGVYGRPLRVGESRTATSTIDAQDMLQGLLGSIAGPQGQRLFGDVKAPPLTTTTTTTYRGLNAQGLHTLETSTQQGPWKVSLNSRDATMPAMSMEMLNANSGGTQTYRADGMPGSSTQKSNMKMKMTMVMEGAQVTMTMTMDQNVTVKPK